jgi:ribosome-associated protein
VDYTDVVVLCTGTNQRQARAIAEEVNRVAKHELGVAPDGIEGLDAGWWVLVDFGSVIVHVFEQSMRGFYDLDALWTDAVRLPVPESAAAPDQIYSFP